MPKQKGITVTPTHFHEAHFTFEAGDTLMGEFADLAKRGRNAAVSVHDYKQLQLTDKTVTELAALTKSLAFADNKWQSLATRIDSMRKRAQTAVEDLRQQIEGDRQRVAADGRWSRQTQQHVAGLPADKRTAFVRERLKAGDLPAVNAVIGAPYYVCGLSEAEHDMLVASYERECHADKLARIDAISDAQERLDAGATALHNSIEREHPRSAIQAAQSHQERIKAAEVA